MTYDPSCAGCQKLEVKRLETESETYDDPTTFRVTDSHPDFELKCNLCVKYERERLERVQVNKEQGTTLSTHYSLHKDHVIGEGLRNNPLGITPEAELLPRNDGGQHFDAGKPSLALLSRISLEDTARVLDYGTVKYSAWNWRKGISWTAIMNSALRHLYAFNDGEDLDEESGLSHLAHAMCDVMFLLEYYHLDDPNDDRYKGNSDVQG